MATEVLTKTLAAYADETTKSAKAMEAATQVTTFSKLMDTLKKCWFGWAKTFEIIFGDLTRVNCGPINDALELN